MSVGIVAVVLVSIDAAEVGQRLARAEAGWLLAAGALLTVQTLLMAMRWRLTAAWLGLRIGWRQAVGEYYIGQLVNVTLPGGVIGDAARAVRSRDRGGLTASAHAVMIERLAGQVAMAVVVGLGFAATLAMPGGIVWPRWTGVILLAAVCAVALAIGGTLLLSRRQAIVRSFTGNFRRAVLSPAVLPQQIALGLAIVALNLAAFAACARATQTALPFEAIVTIVPLILTAMLIPVSVAGLGWREGAAAALFPLVVATPDAGVAASLAFGLVLVGTSLPGLIWIVGPPATRAGLADRRTKALAYLSNDGKGPS